MGEDISDKRKGLLDVVAESQVEYRQKASEDPEPPPESNFARWVWRCLGLVVALAVANYIGMLVYLSWQWVVNR
jgi:hypothetical protein